MKVVEDKLAEQILKLYVPSQILDLKPIIAGGFVVSLYQSVISRNSPSFTSKVAPLVEDHLKHDFSSPSPFSLLLRKAIQQASGIQGDVLRFGDIDIWFQKDNPVWYSGDPFHFLISDLEPDPPKKDSFQLQLPLSHSNQEYPKTYYNTNNSLTSQLDYLGLSSNHGIRSATNWANTFYTKNVKVPDFSCPIQMVKKPQEDTEGLLDSFDILNCCAAYHDGKFYFSDGFEEAFKSNYLQKGKYFNKRYIQDKIWGANRAFKYARRYGLEFSKEICEETVHLFVDAEEFVEKLNKGSEEDKVVKLTDIEFEDAYGRIMTRVSKETIMSITKTMFSNFEDLVLMKHFNKDYIFLFLNSKDPGIMHEVQKYIELQEKLARGEVEAKEVSWNERYNGFF